MTPDQLRSWCLEMPGAVEAFPFRPSVSVFRVGEGGKIFAISTLGSEPLAVSVKCDPDIAHSLRDSHESVTPGYHLNKRHWITIEIGGDLADERVKALIEDSYDLVKPKRRAS